jgi:hypothetical protein
MADRYWERKHGFISEHTIDARWVLREYDDPNDPPKAWGSLRIVSHPDLPAGYLRAVAEFVTSRKPKTQLEIEQAKEDYQMDDLDLEVYSVDEHITTQSISTEDTKQNIEKQFGVKIFE